VKWALANCSHAGIRCWAEIAQRSHFLCCLPLSPWLAQSSSAFCHGSRNGRKGKARPTADVRITIAERIILITNLLSPQAMQGVVHYHA